MFPRNFFAVEGIVGTSQLGLLACSALRNKYWNKCSFEACFEASESFEAFTEKAI